MRQALLSDLSRRHRGLVAESMLSYYQSVAPDLLDEFESSCRNGARKKAAGSLAKMSRHYLNLVRVRARSPEEYERLVALDKLEYEARQAGRRIAKLRRLKERGLLTEDRRTELAETKRVLVQKLAACFARSQSNQLVEVTRLEAELKTMRNLLEKRAANRETILRRQYFRMAGEDAGDLLPLEQRPESASVVGAD